MSTLLTPSRRERAKRKSRAAHSMSPSFGAKANGNNHDSSSSSSNGRNQRYQSMQDNIDDYSGHSKSSKSVSSSSSKSSSGKKGGFFVKPRVAAVTPTKNKKYSTDLRQPHLDNNYNSSPGYQPDSFAAAKQYRQSRAAGQTAWTTPSNNNSTNSSFVERRSVSLDQEDYEFVNPYSIDEVDEDMPMDEMMDLAVGARTNTGTGGGFTPKKNSGGVLNVSYGSVVSNTSSTGARSHNGTRSTILIETDSSAASSPANHPGFVTTIQSRGGGSPNIGIGRMIEALQNGSTSRPSDLSREERILWDALQTAMVNDRNEHVSKHRNLEMCLQESTAQLGEMHSREGQLEIDLQTAQQKVLDLEHQIVNNSMVELSEEDDDEGEEDGSTGKSLSKQFVALQEEMKAKDEQMEKQQEEHEAAVRAIQRVLADITTEKDEMMESFEVERKKLQESFDVERKKLESSSKERGSDDLVADDFQATSRAASAAAAAAAERLDDLKAALQVSEKEKQTAKREVDEKARQVVILEQELDANKKDLTDLEEAKKVTLSEKEGLQSKLDELQAKITTLRAENEVLSKEKAEMHKEVEDSRSMAADAKAKADEAERMMAEIQQRSVADGDAGESDAPETETPLPQPSDDNDDEEVNRNTPRGTKQLQKKQDLSSIPVEEYESLKKTLAETTSSLETSKKIIASMESANGSLAVDMRSKLKAKEDELVIVQREADERKRRLDSLATELRDLQNKHGEIEQADRRIKSQLMKQQALMGHLESSLADLQSAVVVFEAGACSGAPGGSNMDEISEILGDTLYAVKLTLDATEQFVDDYDDTTSLANTDVSLKSDVGRHIDAIIKNDREAAAKDLRKDLDQKQIAVKRLEEALKKQNEEMKKLRSQLGGQTRPSGDDKDEMRAEIENLRNQVSTNLEVLANKERELHVLRSSLKVDDNETGYISDDASDDEDEADQQSTYSSPARLNGYGPADAEALATILSQTSASMDGPVRARELESLKNDFSKIKAEKETFEKELNEERNSLASAKLIISSLENANKQMMEDLRSRLQDSNSAIAALLEKSMEHETTSEKLKEEVLRLEKEKEEERERYNAELKKLEKEPIGSPPENGGACEVISHDKTQELQVPCEEKKEEELDESHVPQNDPAV
eukprot:CAMPEP_0113455094 /NCGR_PEP_ID=MMETSP0014_2-20120614/8199_1 /TAXON_ID=2857 /ORGANISM="Nitzschia sp." /LENGTH=1149 /DNA_ID=CAMNT_0000346515 /DNA_START=208 /DNA_END=3657 /DNA_ORIENTATION=+ /assembly_acc=CAM_ASM_000159